MRRALRIGLFIGTFIGMSACAMAPHDDGARGAYGSIEAGRTR
jgi:predicted O-methyltransferase YrrM